MYRLFFLLLRIPVFSVASSAAIALASSGQVLYPIDATQRGTEIINTFNSLAHATGTKVPEVALQTTLGIVPYATYKQITKGIIPYVQSIAPTTYNTLLIVTYLSPQIQGVPQYVVLPAEQVTALLYFRTTANLPTSTDAFMPRTISGTLPYYSVDPKQRAIDIAFAVTALMAAPFKTVTTNQVWVQTTLTGPFNPPVADGLLKNVTAVFVSNSLIQFTFLPPGQGTALTVIVAPEQVERIIYVLTASSS